MKMKKLLSAALAAVMLLSAVPAMADNDSSNTSDTIRVEFEDFVPSRKMNITNALTGVSGDCILYDGIQGQQTFDTTVNVAKAGKYTFKIWANSKTDWYSGIEFSVNGGQYHQPQSGTWEAWNSTFSGNVPYPFYAEKSGNTNRGWWNKVFTNSEAIILAEGENTISFKVLTPAQQNGKCYALMDCYEVTLNEELTMPTNAVDDNGVITVQAEDWYDLNERSGKDNGDAKGPDNEESKTYVKLWRYAYETLAYNAWVDVPSAGYYKIDTAASCYTAGKDYLSKMTIAAGGKQVLISDTTATTDSSYTGININNTYKSTELYKLNDTFLLNKGRNRIQVITNNQKNSGVTDGGTLHIAALDYIKLTPDTEKNNSLPKIGNGVTLECEDYITSEDTSTTTWAKHYKKELTEASGGATAVWHCTTAYTPIEMQVNAEETGKYDLGIAYEDVPGWRSEVHLLVDGKELTTTKNETLYQSNAIENKDTIYVNLYTANDVELDKGVHTIKITLDKVTNNNNLYVAALDCVKIAPADDREFTAGAETMALDRNKTGNIVIKSGGKTITASDVYSITYVSSNEEIATVNGDGVVTAKNGGSATITANVKATSLSAVQQVKVKVTVADDRDAWITGASAESGLSFKVNLKAAAENKIDVFTAVFDGDKLVQVLAKSIEKDAKDLEVNYKADEIQKPTGGEYKVFVWNNQKAMISGQDRLVITLGE